MANAVITLIFSDVTEVRYEDKVLYVKTESTKWEDGEPKKFWAERTFELDNVDRVDLSG